MSFEEELKKHKYFHFVSLREFDERRQGINKIPSKWQFLNGVKSNSPSSGWIAYGTLLNKKI